jgi:hypothetical protein
MATELTPSYNVILNASYSLEALQVLDEENEMMKDK